MTHINDQAGAMAELPDGWWKEDTVAKRLSGLFSSHIVGMLMPLVVEGKPRFSWFTGFLLQVADFTFWLTARHILEEIERLREDCSVNVTGPRWVDSATPSDILGVPLDLNDIPLYKDPEIDFGGIFIKPGYAAPLLAGSRVVCLTPEAWFGQEKASPEGYYLVGMPCEWCEEEVVGSTKDHRIYQCSATVVCNPVEAIGSEDRSGNDDFWNHPEAFFGRVLEVTDENGRPLTSIKGMSGGPVLSIERTLEGRLKYRLVGIQSAWLPQSRILRAEPISKVADIIVSWFESIKDVTNGESSARG